MSAPINGNYQIMQNLGFVGGNDGDASNTIGGGESLAQAFNMNKEMSQFNMGTPAAVNPIAQGGLYNNSIFGMTGNIPSVTSFNSPMNMGSMTFNPLMGGMYGGMFMNPQQLAQYEQTQDKMLDMSERQTQRMDEFNIKRMQRSIENETKVQGLKQKADIESEQIQRNRDLEKQLLIQKADELHSKIIDNRKDEIVGKFRELVEKIKTSPENQRRIVLPNGSTKLEPPTEEMAIKMAINVYNSQYGDLEANIKNNLSGSFAQGLKRLFTFGLADRENADSIWAKIYHGGNVEVGDQFFGLQWIGN